MKAFIAVTLLAACVAAQTFDQTTTTGLLNNPLFWKNTKETGLGNLFNNVWGQQNQYDVKGFNTITILSLDQLIRHPLFQSYITLPLFRQHFEHPIFQLYLTTPYFQQYWIYPEFQTFFRNPYLFYKYVYPVVFHTEATTNGVWEPTNVWNKDINNVWTKTVIPTVQNLDINNWVNKVQTPYTPYTFDTLNTNKINYNVVMNKIFKDLLVNKPEVTEIMTPTVVDEQVVRKMVNPITGEIKYFKIVGDKLVQIPVENINFNTFNTNKPVNTLVQEDLVKDAILKKLYLNKIFGNKRTVVDNIFPTGQRFVVPENKYEIFPTMDNVEQIKEQMMMNKQYETLPIDSNVEELKEQMMMNKQFETLPTDKVQEIKEQLMMNKYDTLPITKTFLQGDLLKDAILKKLYLNKIFGNKKTIVDQIFPTVQRFAVPENKIQAIKEELMTKFEITPFEAEKLINELIKEEMMKTKYETLPMDSVKVQNLNEQIKEELMMNKFEKVPMANIRNRRHVLYNTPIVPTTYAHQQPIYKSSRNLYTVPLTYGVQTPVTTYNVPATTYTNQQYQVQPNLYYPGQTIYV